METEYNTPTGIHCVPAFQDNYIWLVRKKDAVVVVDPGDAAPVLEAMSRHGLRLAAILLTHHHPDHVGGVLELLARWSVPVYGPASESLPHCDVPLQEADTVDLPELDLHLSVLSVPGHTAGHIAYYGRAAGKPVLFCGDTLFACGCGRLFEGTPGQMHASLGKLAALEDDTLVYCAHEYTLSNIRWAMAVEPDNTALAAWAREAAALREAGRATVPTRLAHEREVNPFLRTAHPEVVAAVSNQVGRALQDGVDVFGALRAWKDEFR